MYLITLASENPYGPPSISTWVFRDEPSAQTEFDRQVCRYDGSDERFTIELVKIDTDTLDGTQLRYCEGPPIEEDDEDFNPDFEDNF